MTGFDPLFYEFMAQAVVIIAVVNMAGMYLLKANHWNG